MKYLVLSLILSALALPVFADDEDASAMKSICEYTRNNDRSTVRRKLSEEEVDIRHVYDLIKCKPDGSLLRTAINANASDTAEMLIIKMGKRITTEKEDGISNLDYAKKKLAGASGADKEKLQAIIDKMEK